MSSTTLQSSLSLSKEPTALTLGKMEQHNLSSPEKQLAEIKKIYSEDIQKIKLDQEKILGSLIKLSKDNERLTKENEGLRDRLKNNEDRQSQAENHVLGLDQQIQIYFRGFIQSLDVLTTELRQMKTQNWDNNHTQKDLYEDIKKKLDRNNKMNSDLKELLTKAKGDSNKDPAEDKLTDIMN